MVRKLAVKVDCVIAHIIVEFDVAFHETYGVDQTGGRGDNTANAKDLA